MEIDNNVSSTNTKENHKSYKSSYQTDPAYDKTIDENTFNLVENLSISLNNIMNSYGASRELHRKVVGFVSTVIRDNEKLEQRMIVFFPPDTVDGLMRNTLPIHGHTYDICKNGCKMFKLNDENDDTCNYCGEDQYKPEESLQPVSTMKIISIVGYLSNMLSNEETRSMLLYRSNREAKNNVYQDIFDGDIYKSLKQQNLFDNDLDITLALFVDDYNPEERQKNNENYPL
ncbi:unnamed protein product [Rhizopus microsporus]